MDLSRYAALIAPVTLMLAPFTMACSSHADDCNLMSTCPPGAATGGGNTPDSGTSSECVPSQTSGPVGDTCGIFVSSNGNDSNAGTKGNPVATLGQALTLAKGTLKPIYVCAEAFSEALEVSSGTALYGGLDCSAGWLWTESGRTTLTAAPDLIPMKLTSGSDVTKIERFSVIAADALQLGGSSIALIADNVPVEIIFSELSSGSGRDGPDGQTDPSFVPQNGEDGKPGSDACINPQMVMGGLGATAICNNGISQGGDGGQGGITGVNGGVGKPGSNGQPEGSGSGLGGKEQVDTNVACTPGTDGMDGEVGAPGAGGTALGTISISGIVGADGQSGGWGTPGQGGGGGGGAKSGPYCSNLMDGPGASGGGGGSGGCGGKGGGGGQAGGSSIAIISLNATIKLSNVTLTAGAGGKGGAGATALTGGQGGAGAFGGNKGFSPSKVGCFGGDGGYGGDGGGGGGGRGGHSIGIAYRGARPDTTGLLITAGAPGQGGAGGFNNPTGGGDWGISSTGPLEFP